MKKTEKKPISLARAITPECLSLKMLLVRPRGIHFFSLEPGDTHMATIGYNKLCLRRFDSKRMIAIRKQLCHTSQFLSNTQSNHFGGPCVDGIWKVQQFRL
uniref:tRNA(m1A58)-methyltransferase subunit TRM6 n=1 Tax=Taenia asiatica TaxID=60517 RepID=A0A0R3W3Y7_TAEAS